MNVKIIKNDSEYHEALQLLSELIQNPYDPGSDIENDIGVLLLVIKDYEERVTEPLEVDPVDAIKFRMKQMNLRNKDLVEFVGSVSKVSEILNRKRSLSLNMIRRLHEGLGIPLRSLHGTYKEPLENISSGKIDYSLFPIVEMKKRGDIKNLPKNYKDYSEEIIKEFCKEYYNVLEQNVAYLRAPLHLRGKKSIDKYALSIWQICVLKKAENLNLCPYDPSLINEKWLRKLIELSEQREGVKLAKEQLERYGIALIIVPHFNKTFLDGAAMMFKGRPIIALTQRYNRLDNFWFVLAHELAHLIKHLDCNESGTYFDDLDVEDSLDDIEMEADSVANEALIPAKHWEDLRIATAKSIDQINYLAKKTHVCPAIIAGRLRYERKDFKKFTKIVCEKVNL